MENFGVGTFLRSRRFGSYFEAGSDVDFDEPAKVVEVKQKQKQKAEDDDDDDDDVYEEDDGWLSVLISWIRIVVCFVSMTFTTLIWALIMLLLLPWPYQRIRQGNIYGHVTSRMLILRNPIKIENAEYCKERAIFMCAIMHSPSISFSLCG